jgi:hypothetical protein
LPSGTDPRDLRVCAAADCNVQFAAVGMASQKRSCSVACRERAYARRASADALAVAGVDEAAARRPRPVAGAYASLLHEAMPIGEDLNARLQRAEDRARDDRFVATLKSRMRLSDAALRRAEQVRTES